MNFPDLNGTYVTIVINVNKIVFLIIHINFKYIPVPCSLYAYKSGFKSGKANVCII